LVKIDLKSAEEIRYSLRDARKVALFVCDFCANLSGNGGVKGKRYLRKRLEEWGKEVVLSENIMAICSEEIIAFALKKYRKSIDECDAIVLGACSIGVRATLFCDPGVPVIGLSDPVGISVISRQAEHMDICRTCGHCVISFTAGICPLSRCPAGRLYEPCEKRPLNGTLCALDPQRQCVWSEIEKVGDLEALRDLKRIHEDESIVRLSDPPPFYTRSPLKKFICWLFVRLSKLGAGRITLYIK